MAIKWTDGPRPFSQALDRIAAMSREELEHLAAKMVAEQAVDETWWVDWGLGAGERIGRLTMTDIRGIVELAEGSLQRLLPQAIASDGRRLLRFVFHLRLVGDSARIRATDREWRTALKSMTGEEVEPYSLLLEMEECEIDVSRVRAASE